MNRSSKTLPHLKEVDVAWLAGLLEGEGSFTLQQPLNAKGEPRTRIAISLQMTDLDVLEKVASLVGDGKVLTAKRQAGHHKETWRWQISSRGITAELMARILPYMSKRRVGQIIKCLNAAYPDIED
jgi:hypothetical protein